MLSASAAFKAFLDDPQQKMQHRWIFPRRAVFGYFGGCGLGTNPFGSGMERWLDFYDNVLRFGTFSQKQEEGKPVSFPTVSVDLSNASQEMNFLLTQTTWNGIGAELQFSFDGIEWITKLKGSIANFNFRSDREPIVQLDFRSKLAGKLDVYVAAVPSSVRVRSLVETELMADGILHDRTTVDNADVDLDSLDAWETAEEYDALVSGSASGTETTAAEYIRRMSLLDDTMFFAELDGRLRFSYYPTATPTAVYTFTDTNAHFDKANLTRNTNKIVNLFTVWYATTPGSWLGSVSATSAASVLKHGSIEKVLKDTILFAKDATVAQNIADRLIQHYQEPPLQLVFTAGRGTQAFLLQLGDFIAITWAQAGFTSKLFRIYGISANLQTHEYTFTVEEWV